LPRQSNEILPPPPPLEKDIDPFSKKKSNDKPQAFTTPLDLEENSVRGLPSHSSEDHVTPPPPPLRHNANSAEQSSFTAAQQRDSPRNDKSLNARTATSANTFREGQRVLPTESLPDSGSEVQQQQTHRPPPPQPPAADVTDNKTAMNAASFQRQNPPQNVGRSTTGILQQHSYGLPPPRSISQQQQQHLAFSQQQYLPPPRQAGDGPVAGTAGSTMSGRLPPPGYRNSIPKPAAVGLQALWKRVEQSLDSLADLEDQFSNGAQRIASSALQSTLAWRRQPPQQQGTTRQQAQRPPQQFNVPLTTVRKPSPTTSRNPHDPAPVISLTKSYQENVQSKQHEPVKRLAGGPQATTIDAEASTGGMIRSARWNNIMTDKGQKVALQSNGGASHSPHDRFSGATSSLPPSRPLVDMNPGMSAESQHQRWPPPPSEQQPPWSRAAPFARDATTLAASADGPRRKRPFLEEFSGATTSPVDRESASSMPRKNSFYEDEDDRPSLLSRLGKFVPPIPRFPSIFKLLKREGSFREYAALDAWKDEDDDSRNGKGIFGLFRRSPRRTETTNSARKTPPKTSLQLTPPLNDLMDRCDHGKTASLLSRAEIRACRNIGNSRAALDVVCLVFLLLTVHQMPNVGGIPLPSPLADMFSGSLTGLGHNLLFTMQTWAPFAFASAFLTARTNDIMNGGRTKQLALATASTAKEAGTYGQLYLRLTASQPPITSIPERLYQAAEAQVIGRVEAARLRSFVSLVLIALVLMTVSVVRPVAMESIKTFVAIASLNEWRHWPLPWKELGSSLLLALRSLYHRVTFLVTQDLSGLLENPYQFAFHISLFIALSVVYFLPSLEHRRPILDTISKPSGEEDGSVPSFGSVESLSNMGISSAARLQLWASGAGIEGALEKWRMMLPSLPRARYEWFTSSHLRQAGYGVLIALLLSLPVLVRTAVGISESIISSHSIFQWDSALDVTTLLLFTLHMSWRAMRYIVESMDSRPSVHGFLKDVSTTMDEVSILRKSHMDLQLVAAISPTKGLAVSDLWAAHAAKRAWAVRGANLECRNGELVVIIGDDGAGKTRLLTAIAESMVFPPKESLSTTKVRGLISMGGVDVTKWDRGQLKRRLGLVLNDVRTVADSAELLSGLTLEEILEPSDALQVVDPSHTAGANERNSMILALKVSHGSEIHQTTRPSSDCAVRLIDDGFSFIPIASVTYKTIYGRVCQRRRLETISAPSTMPGVVTIRMVKVVVGPCSGSMYFRQRQFRQIDRQS
jgi:hypothetical protein